MYTVAVLLVLLAVMAIAAGFFFASASMRIRRQTLVLKSGMRSMHLPEAVVSLSSICARIRYGYSYQMMRPIDSLAENEVPILFIHGAEDSFIPPEHSERMQKETKGYSELHLIPGAAHAASVLTEPEEYGKTVTSFLAYLGIEQ